MIQNFERLNTIVILEDESIVGYLSYKIKEKHTKKLDVDQLVILEQYRGKGICKKLMETVRENAKTIGIKELYLYTKHIGLYEKFGWKFIEEVKTFREDSPIERLYKLEI